MIDIEEVKSRITKRKEEANFDADAFEGGGDEDLAQHSLKFAATLRDALAAIEQLQAENAELRAKAPEWSTRKPKERGIYLVKQAHSDDPSICNYGTSRGWGNGRYNRLDNPYRVTHWMPLPTPPAEEKS